MEQANSDLARHKIQKSDIYKTDNLNIVFVSYANGKIYEISQRKYEETAFKIGEINEYYSYNMASFLHLFLSYKFDFKFSGFQSAQHLIEFIYQNASATLNNTCKWNKDLFFWIWKPFITYFHLNKIHGNNSWIIYADSSRWFRNGFKHSLRTFIKHLIDKNISSIPAIRIAVTNDIEWHKGYGFCKKGSSNSKKCETCIKLRDEYNITGDFEEIMYKWKWCKIYDTECIMKYKYQPEYQGSFGIWKKTELNLFILREWMKWYYNKYAILYFPYQDQHALGYMITKYNLTVPYLFCRKEFFKQCKSGQYAKDPNMFLDIFQNEKKYKYLKWVTSDMTISHKRE